MARIRTIKPEFWTDEKVIRCSMPARLLFIGVLNFCDDAANIEDSSLQLKVKIFPGDSFTVAEIDAMVQEHIDVGLSVRYEVQGRRYLHVVSFHKHQKPDHPTAPTCPLFPGQEYTYDTRNKANKWERITVSSFGDFVAEPVVESGHDGERSGNVQGTFGERSRGLGLGLEGSNTKPTARKRAAARKVTEYTEPVHKLYAYYVAEVRDDPSCKSRALDWIDRRLAEHSMGALGDAIAQYAEQMEREKRDVDKRKNAANFFGQDQIYLGFPERLPLIPEAAHG